MFKAGDKLTCVQARPDLPLGEYIVKEVDPSDGMVKVYGANTGWLSAGRFCSLPWQEYEPLANDLIADYQAATS